MEEIENMRKKLHDLRAAAVAMEEALHSLSAAERPAEGTSDIELAFRALWDFCETEMGWEYFRAEFDLTSCSSQTLQNARKLQQYLEGMKSNPVVAECLGS